MTNKGGAGFPRDALAGGEKVLLELKPNFLPFLLAPLAAITILLVLGAFWFLWLAVRDVQAAALLCGSGTLFVLLPIVGVGTVLGYFRWRATFYAVTDRRVVVKTGLVGTTVVDAPHPAVQNVTMTQNGFQRLFGYGTVVFATSGTGGGAPVP